MGSCPYVWSIWSRGEIVVRILTLILTQPICWTGIYPTLLMMLLKGKGCLSIACGNNNKHVKMFAYIYCIRVCEVRFPLPESYASVWCPHFARSSEICAKQHSEVDRIGKWIECLVLFTIIFITGLRKWIIMKLLRNSIFCGSISLHFLFCLILIWNRFVAHCPAQGNLCIMQCVRFDSDVWVSGV